MIGAMVREERDSLEAGPLTARRIEGWHRSPWVHFKAGTEDDPVRAAPRGSVGPSGGDGEPPPFDPSKERDRDVATKSRAKTKRPPRGRRRS